MGEGDVHTAIIRYRPGTLTIFVDDLDTPVLSVSINIATTIALGDGEAWVGFTAGGYLNDGRDQHTILNWKFSEPAETQPPRVVGINENFSLKDYNDHATFFRGHSYLLIVDAQSWEEANAFATSLGGYITTINDSTENIYLTDLVQRLDQGTFHIGLNDQNREGNFVWANGEPVSYTNWNEGEPNDGGGGEDLVSLDPSFGYRWNDHNFSGTFIVEFDSDPIAEPPRPVETVIPAQATATPIAAATATPPSASPVQLMIALTDVGPGVGLGSAGAPVELLQQWGVGEGLFARDRDGATVNRLAESFTLASDLSYADVTILSPIPFHNSKGNFGNLTADDIVWTMEDASWITNPDSTHHQAREFSDTFDYVSKIDETTVRFGFKAFNASWAGQFLSEQAGGTAFFSKRAYDTLGEDWMLQNIVSTGPYEVERWVQNDQVLLSKVNYNHWRKNADADSIWLIAVPEQSTRRAMLEVGQAAAAEDLPSNITKSLQQDGFIADSITGKGLVHNIIFSGNYWETNHAITGEDLQRDDSAYCATDIPWVGCNIVGQQPGDMEEARNVRWALAKAIDRQLIVDAVFDGFGNPASMEYIDTTAPYFHDRWLIPYDPVSAQQHMSLTAWPTGDFEIGIWIGPEHGGVNGTGSLIMEIVGDMWRILWPNMDVQLLKASYASIRPGFVARTNSIPYAGDCAEGQVAIPFDWPHGKTETSITRGGFGCSIEIPEIAETYLNTSAQPNQAIRTQQNTALIDYLYDQMLFAGTVQVPTIITYNPQIISSWSGTPSTEATMNEFEFIEVNR